MNREYWVNLLQTYFTLLQIDRKNRLETIQVGILLSALHLHSGRFDKAHFVIATCYISVGQLMWHEVDADGESKWTVQNFWQDMNLLDRRDVQAVA